MEHILMYHYIKKSMHIRMMQLSFGLHFQFAGFRNKITFFRKGLRSTTYTWNFSTKFCTFKYENIKKNLP
jgi:hypothetical protein